MSDLDIFRHEIEKLGFFGMLKHAALTVILGSRGISNHIAYEKGVLHGQGRMNLFPASGDDVIWIAPVDIEVYWTEGGVTANGTKYFFRTKSGREFEVTEESWLRIMHGNEYRKPSAK